MCKINEVNLMMNGMVVNAESIGYKIRRVRELRGFKQEVFALALGISQAGVSNIEKSIEVDDRTLRKIAEVIGVSTDAIKHFNEEALIVLMKSMDTYVLQYKHQFQFSFNPLDKVVELYERLLQSQMQLLEMKETQ